MRTAARTARRRTRGRASRDDTRPLITSSLVDFTAGLRGTRPRTATRAKEATRFDHRGVVRPRQCKRHGRGLGAQEAREHEVRLEQLRQSRDHWRTRAETKQRLQDKNDETWERLRRRREEFEQEFVQKVTGGLNRSSKDTVKFLRERMDKLHKNVQAEGRQKEAREE